MSSKQPFGTFQEKVIRKKMPITNILISQRGGLSSNSTNATLVFHGQEYDLSTYMNQQGGGDININISDKGVRIASKKKRGYFQNAPVPKKQQHFQTVPVAEDEQQQQHFQAVPVAEDEQQQHLWTVPVAIAGVVIVSFLYLRWK